MFSPTCAIAAAAAAAAASAAVGAAAAIEAGQIGSWAASVACGLL